MKFLYLVFCFLIISCDLTNEADIDCNGEQHGLASIDDCGVCNGNNDAMDCRKYQYGEHPDYCFGDYYYDQCDICDNTLENDDLTCLGCDAVPNSGLEIDDCGVCGGNDDCDCPGYPIGTTQDCTGECDGASIIDDCGICNGNNDTYGCDGECLNHSIDICGTCNGIGVIDCMCDSYIVNNDYSCTSELVAPYNLEDTLGCDALEAELSMCYPENCDNTFKLADFEDKIIWIIYEADW